MRALVIGGLLAALAGVAAAQPTPADLARAKELYLAGEAAMKAASFAAAVEDYGAAYELTRDPVLFFKIGQANERAGHCDVALVYYRRYLDEARPNEDHVRLTRARIAVCEAAAPPAGPVPAPPPPSPPPVTGVPAPSPQATPAVSTPPTAVPAAPPAGAALAAHDQTPWLFVTGGVALLTIGAVLAYSANASEADIADLYVGFGGDPPMFNERTQRTYDELVAQGRRYERLSWLSFGLAGACGITAGVLFYRSHGERSLAITPTASPTSAGVSASLRF